MIYNSHNGCYNMHWLEGGHDMKSALWSLLHDEIGDGKDRLLRDLYVSLTEQKLYQLSGIELSRAYPELDAGLWNRFVDKRDHGGLDERYAYLKEQKIRVLTPDDREYPALLKEVYDAPVLLYAKGADIKDKLRIAVVGSRKASHYGKDVAHRLGKDLSLEGVCIVSGLARGIDGQAHKGALQASGGTIAVLGSGIDRIYPAEHRDLYQAIHSHESGTILSECPLGSAPLPYRFPRRNRIISGLASGLLVVEAAKKSGALITARLALEIGRDVFAIPGLITNPISAGCHSLIQDGAKLVTSVQDILDEFGQGVLFHEEDHLVSSNIDLDLDEAKVYQMLSVVPLELDKIIEASSLSVDKVMAILSLLEVYGLVESLPGRYYKVIK